VARSSSSCFRTAIDDAHAVVDRIRERLRWLKERGRDRGSR
jgi:hypothetical protein